MTKSKPFEWYNELSAVFMGRGYFHNPEDTIESRTKSIADGVGKYFGEEIRNKVEEYISLGYYVLPSPVWSNFGTIRGAGISCFNLHVSDSIESIVRGNAEVGILCKVGGGTSSFWGDVRPEGSPISTGGRTLGPMHFIPMYDETKSTINQNSVRRGEHAVFMNIDHKDIMDFLSINSEGHKLQRLPFGVTVTRKWLQAMKEGDVSKRVVWAKVLDSRNNTGFPYIFFEDNVNEGTADVYKDKGMRIKSTNMCTEILLPSTEEESFVCDLVGMNAEKFEEWSQTDAVRIAVYIADAVLQDFIDRYKDVRFIERTIRFAERHRAIAIGMSGYHSFLQSKMIPFESMEAKMWNVRIFKHLREEAEKASEEMAEKYGKPEVLKEDKYKRRHTCLLSVAPNTSSSVIMEQQSPSIELFVSNYYLKKAAKLLYPVKNKYLATLLEGKGKNTTEIWESILKRDGSVQHLDFLDEKEKMVFRTFIEVSQMEVIIQASQRQKFIDQGQSLNLMIHPSTPTKDVNALILKAEELGIKTLYYQLGQNAAQQFARDILSCESCQG